ncbi:MAG: DUF3016 domain-containing protein [Rhodocyclaceae bacterium]|jgi:hypothetical protein|nr:DUF3016 domain-containing protein [Rhodocyclaceae bacterium]MCA3081260.1 DUF3016 domain-containing protein [Rhodocyclaceae bacterium]
MIRRPIFLTLLALLTSVSVTAPLMANAAVTVTFTKADQYIDVPFSPSDREATLKTLKEHFQKLGSKLPTGQDLKIEVLEIDLAGRTEPSRMSGANDLRVLRGGADWPMIQLRYSVEAAGKPLKQGEARISDQNYLNHMNRYPSSEPLRYEKAMLDDWFKKEILSAK